MISNQPMDNLTHTLYGVALSRTGLNRMMRHATLTLMVAVNLPDIDIVSGFWGSLAYLKYHRGITHSIMGVSVLGVLLGAIVYFFQKRAWKKSPDGSSAPSLWAILLVCLIGTWSHLLMDFTNAYGVRPFMPFSDRWVALDIESIVDPVLLGILIVGLLMPALFALISEEVGERGKLRGRGAAVAALVLVAALWGVREVNHRSAIDRLSAFTYGGQDPSETYALPYPANPFVWNGVAETAAAYYQLDVDEDFSALILNRAKVHYKPEDSDVLRAARETYTGQVFLNFARMPIYSVQKRGENTEVTIRDLRFASFSRSRRGFVATVLLSRDLKVVSQKFSFTG